MEISEKVFEAANRRGTELRGAFPAVVKVRYDHRIHRIVVSLETGLELAFSPKNAEGLEHAQPAELADAEVSPSGLGIHFPHLDADLYLPALLEGFLGSRRWLAAEQGKIGGKVSSEAKSAAARLNGKLGGRPKKEKEAA